MTRFALTVRGVVQGVGFRPFVLQSAVALGLVGWVRNTRDAVRIEVQGSEDAVQSFVSTLRSVPPPARVSVLEQAAVPDGADEGFEIEESALDSDVGAVLPPDLATCVACLAEVRDPSDRRYGHAFANCTRCGPRLSITERLPYDRVNTSMAMFAMCDDCRRQYEDVTDRRYHAQPIACPKCGPELRLVDRAGRPVGLETEPIASAVDCISSGGVVAMLGLGGFQLLVDATAEAAVAELRRRKHRPDKALAVMFRDEEQLQRSCRAGEADLELLGGPSAPIVLLPWVDQAEVVTAVAPLSPWLGAMLPTTPLHHLLLQHARRPLVCTSGNLSEEPMCTDPDEARQRLSAIADVFLVHDRSVVRPVDDSVARTTTRGLELLRRARGYSPQPVAESDGPVTVAFGAHQKSTVTVACRGQLHMSQHIGDLEGPLAVDRLAATVRDMCGFLDVTPEQIACDLHPDYASTRSAERLAARYGVPLIRVQHHHAHVAAVMAEHGLSGPILGLAWDGTGLGGDGSIWGGESLLVDRRGYRRVARLSPFRLPGGDAAARAPWRCAVGLLVAHGLAVPEGAPSRVAARAAARGVNAPLCSSMGRLFDAVAALVLGIEHCSFEGKAAVLLERAAMHSDEEEPYPLPLSDGVADPGPMLFALLADRERGASAADMARRFHEAVIQLGVDIAFRVDESQVVLSGGCFQNLLLRQGLDERLTQAGFSVHVAGRIPVNDGGISAGQAWVAQHQVEMTNVSGRTR